MNDKINGILNKYGKQNSQYTTVFDMSNGKTKNFGATMLIWIPLIIITVILTIKIATSLYDNGIEISSTFFEIMVLILLVVEFKVVNYIVSKKEYMKKMLIIVVEGENTYLYKLNDEKQYEINDTNIKNVTFDDVYSKEKNDKTGFERLNGHVVKINFKEGNALEIGFPLETVGLNINEKCINDFYNNIKKYELDWNVKESY